ncbi:MAG: hypothetical protein A2854_04480 [Parcubacteria group bacterium RIFCSPHIGHO2_01_FULL_56_18]|nr:MAG: hypothetical protein A2854_04480 [Parcubacteria group bacterium RIFCSPHIGHO2_01_FULL_56_18]
MRDSRFVRLILIIFFVLAAGYAAYEAQGLLYGPRIHLENQTFASDTSFVAIKGRAERIAELRINGKTVNVTENGEFDEPFLLAPGSNHLILEARDARGRTALETLDIVYRASEDALVPASHAADLRVSSPATTSSPATSTPESTF